VAGFRYFTRGGSSGNRFRNYLSLAGPERQSVSGSFLIEDGFTGDNSVTGLGFEPEALFLFGAGLDTFTFAFHGILHWGFAAGAGLEQWAGGVHFPHLDDPDHRSSRWSDSRIIAQAADPDGISGVEAELTSFDADGFTIDVLVAHNPVHSAGPNGSRVSFLAIAGGGSYAVGTGKSPLVLGTQAITGLGFEPNCIFFSSAQRYDDTIAGDGLSNSTAGAWTCFGASEIFGGQWSAWCGATTGDIYSTQACQDGACLSLWQDAQAPPAGPFTPGLLAEAVLDSYDGDGFTLDWTTVGSEEYYYSWFAVDGYTQANRWTYNHPSGVVARVRTRRKPKALIFFSSDIAVNGSQVESVAGGASIGLGCAGQRATIAGADQFAASVIDINQAAFFQPQAGRQILDNVAFGCYERRTGSTPPNNMRDRGSVQPFGRDHLLRLHVGP
jgi:hypothetical protein